MIDTPTPESEHRGAPGAISALGAPRPRETWTARPTRTTHTSSKLQFADAATHADVSQPPQPNTPYGAVVVGAVPPVFGVVVVADPPPCTGAAVTSRPRRMIVPGRFGDSAVSRVSRTWL